MKMKNIRIVLALTMLVSAQDVLNNEAVAKMVKSGLGEGLIISMIQNQPGSYAVSPDEALKLKEAGVSERILTAMAAKNNSRTETSSGSIKIELKTPVRLTVDETISSKTAKPGEILKLIVAEDLTIDGRIVIGKGAPATGRITAAEKKSFATRNGKLKIGVDSVRAVDGHNVAIDGHIVIGGGGVSYGRIGKVAELEKGHLINAVVASESSVKLDVSH